MSFQELSLRICSRSDKKKRGNQTKYLVFQQLKGPVCRI